MLRIDDRLGSYSIAAGEAWIMSVQMKRMQGSAIIDWSQRRLVLSFYEESRALFAQIEGTYTNDATGAYFAFVRDGRFSESLYGRQLQVELAERLLEGRAIIATGPLTVAPSASGVLSFGSAIGRVDARFTLYFGTAGLIDLIEQELLPYGGNPVTPAPIITSPAAIGSDGTPQVGEVLTGVDPVVTYGSVIARRWLLGSTTLATTQTYTPTSTGDHRFQADIKGADGSTIQSTATTTVAAATVPAPSFTAQPTISGTPTVGQTLTGNPGTISNGSVSARQWLRDGVAISGATAATYALVAADAGKALTFRVTATGGGGSTDATSQAVTVAAAATPVSISGTPPTTGQVGTAYSFTPTTANGSGTKTFTLSSGTLLGGLSFDTATGAIAGTPTVAGTMSGLAITVSDSTGSASTTPTSVTIAAAVPQPAPVTVAFIGSSSPERYVTSGNPTPNDRIRLCDDNGVFNTATTGTFISAMGQQLISLINTGLDVIPGGGGGSTLQQWSDNANNIHYGVTQRVLKAGKLDYVVMQVGGNDIGANTVGTVAQQIAKIRNVIATLRTKFNAPNVPFIINPTQDYGDLAKLSVIRQAEVTVANTDANVYYGISVNDVPTQDGVHQLEPDSYLITGARQGRQLAAIMKGTTQQRGPFLSAVTPVSLTQTDATIQHRLGTDFTPTSGITGFVVYNSAGAQLAVSAAARQSASVVRLTHAARTAGDAGTVLYMPNGGNADDTTVLHDNSTNKLPLESSGSPIALAAFGTATPTPTPTPTYTATGKSAQVNYGRPDNPDVTGWNNRKAPDMRVATALLTPSGAATGWTDAETAAVPDPATGGAATGATANGTGAYPDNVMATYWFHGDAGAANHAFAGLDDSKAYDITLFASRAATDRSTLFTINGSSQTLDASNNTTRTVTFPKVRPTSGAINVSWAKGTVSGVTSGFAYLNAAVLTEYSIT